MRYKSHLGLALLSAIALIRAAPTRAEQPAPPPEGPADAAATTKSPPAVTISKETTYIVEPLRDDGYVDYVAAIDAVAAAGVTPENNALVPLMQAIGPQVIDARVRDRFFDRLGMNPPPAEGNYLVSFRDFLDDLVLRIPAESP